MQALHRPPGHSIFTPEEADLISTAASPAWDAADRTALLGLIAGGQRGWAVFDALTDLGWIARAVPEWQHVVAAPQFAPFHLHADDAELGNV